MSTMIKQIIPGYSSIPTNTVFLQLFTKLFIPNMHNPKCPQQEIQHEPTWQHGWERMTLMRDGRPSDVLPVAPPGKV